LFRKQSKSASARFSTNEAIDEHLAPGFTGRCETKKHALRQPGSIQLQRLHKQPA
jgi:hypothetical protein